MGLLTKLAATAITKGITTAATKSIIKTVGETAVYTAAGVADAVKDVCPVCGLMQNKINSFCEHCGHKFNV